MPGPETDVIDPIELLTNKNDRIPTVLGNLWNPMWCAVVGFGAACMVNWGTRRPIFSGIQKHAALAIGGGIAGKYLDGKRNDYLAKRDAILRHYVELHPDDFPPTKRVKYAEVIEPWVPIR